ncbi:hemolysin family protein [Candidatus Dependentiae bacterium]|nr:hemolysin family protein [Candidatus Dependentiae bacterium]
MSLLYIEVFIFFGALLFAALFAFLETSFTALRLFKMRELETSVSKYKALFEAWEKKPQRILITILIANNFAHVMCSVFIAEIMQKLFGNYGLVFGVGIATVMILIFGEIIPKSFAKAHHEKLFRASLWMVNFLYRILYPLVTLLLKIANFFSNRFGVRLLEKGEDISEKEIEFLIDYSDQKGIIEAEKSEMLQNIFELGETPVNKIMIPRSDIILLASSSSLDDALKVFSAHRYSRLPIYEVKEENIIGFLYHKDVFELVHKKQKKPLKELVRPILFVPETKKCNQLLSEFLKKRMHMSIVINEYGSVVGLATLEDVIEEIVGEIRDEHEKVRSKIVPLEQGGWLIDASVSLDDLEDLLDIQFPPNGSVTLAGFLSGELQHLPRKGERLVYKGYCFQVQQASPRRVFQVLVFEEGEEK